MQKKIAYIFPGQGSQSVGMLDSWSDDTAVRHTIDEASSVLGCNLWTLMRSGPPEELNRTENTQPVLVASSVALLRAWQARGGPAATMAAGHSAGEYSALVAAEALALHDAMRVVQRKRTCHGDSRAGRDRRHGGGHRTRRRQGEAAMRFVRR